MITWCVFYSPVHFFFSTLDYSIYFSFFYQFMFLFILSLLSMLFFFCPGDSSGTCGDPGVPSHGSREESDFRIRSKVHFSCSLGYVLFGSSERMCLPNGTWSGTQPSCKRKQITYWVYDLRALLLYLSYYIFPVFKVRTFIRSRLFSPLWSSPSSKMWRKAKWIFSFICNSVELIIFTGIMLQSVLTI